MDTEKIPNLKRWRRLRLAISMAALLLLLGLPVYMFRIEPDCLTLRNLTLEIPDDRWHGKLKVAVAADMHFRPQDGRRLRRVVAEINRLDADLVVLLGDYVARRDFKDALPPEEIGREFGRIRSRLGTFAILGNHDYWCGAERIGAALQENGITVLVNRVELLSISPEFSVNLAGVDDYTTKHHRPEDTLAQADPRFPTLLLTHNPDLTPEFSSGQAALVLAGHTHGGQVRIPWYGAPVVPSRYGRRYAEGLVMEAGRPPVFITRGVGTSIMRVRFNCPPEIVLLTLSPASP